MSSFSTKHAGLHETLGFFHQGLLVNEGAADQGVFRILAVTGERPDAVDHPLGLFGLLIPLLAKPRNRSNSSSSFFRASCRPCSKPCPPAPGSLFCHVAEDQVQERGGCPRSNAAS